MATSKPFDKVYIEIGNVCNLACPFCPKVLRRDGLMDVELFRSIIAQVAPMTNQVCFHLMGEPLLHPQLEDFVAICHEYGVRIFLVSNGLLLRQKQANLLLHPAFRQVNFSLHSFYANFGDRDPTPYLARIFDFSARAARERPDLYVNYRLWNLSSPAGGETKNLSLLARLQEHYGFTLPPQLDVRRQKSFRIGGRLYLHFDTEFVWPAPDLPLLGTRGRCHGLSLHFGVLVDGTVVPCCLDKEGRLPLGRVQERPIAEILAGEEAQAILQGFRQGRLVRDLCQRCPYSERFQVKTGLARPPARQKEAPEAAAGATGSAPTTPS